MKNKLEYLIIITLIFFILFMYISRYIANEILYFISMVLGLIHAMIDFLYILKYKETIETRLGKFSFKSIMGQFFIMKDILFVVLCIYLILMAVNGEFYF